MMQTWTLCRDQDYKGSILSAQLIKNPPLGTLSCVESSRVTPFCVSITLMCLLASRSRSICREWSQNVHGPSASGLSQSLADHCQHGKTPPPTSIPSNKSALLDSACVCAGDKRVSHPFEVFSPVSKLVLSDLSFICCLVMLALRLKSRVKLLRVRTQYFLAVNNNYEGLTRKLN